MITSKILKAITERMHKAFNSIGVSNGTTMPSSKNNRDTLAWEMYQAHELCSYADARELAAKQRCLAAGMIFDHKEKPLPPGTRQEIFSGEHMSITVQVNNSSPRFDATKLKGVMLRHRISSEVADKVYAECLKETAPAHIFRAIPKVG